MREARRDLVSISPYTFPRNVFLARGVVLYRAYPNIPDGEFAMRNIGRR